MRKFLVVLGITVFCPSLSDAGPILNLIENRQDVRNTRRSATHKYQYQYQYQYQSVSKTTYVVPMQCPNGQCPLQKPGTSPKPPVDTTK